MLRQDNLNQRTRSEQQLVPIQRGIDARIIIELWRDLPHHTRNSPPADIVMRTPEDGAEEGLVVDARAG